MSEEDVLACYVDDVAYNVLREPASRTLIDQRIAVTSKRDPTFRQELMEGLAELGIADRLEFVDHHRAHAASAFYCSPFDEALVVVMDARGDYKSCSTYVGRGRTLSLVDVVSDLNSPGVVYSFVTRLLGFTPDRHEGKITGLAAYGNSERTREVFEEMISIDHEGRIRAQIGKCFSPFMTGTIPHIEGVLAKHTPEDIAAGVQVWLERLVVQYVRSQLKKHPCSAICLAGGIFSNVKVNQRVREIQGINNVYIHQHMGDGGASLGSALDLLYRTGGEIERPLRDVYLGPEYSREEIVQALDRHRRHLHIQELTNTAETAARLLASGSAVGWFQGRMEYGPRALCNRSILVQATDPDINDTLNKRLERTEFMPFAPVTLDRFADASYEGWRPDHIASRYMTMCYDCRPTVRSQSPAIVHVDNTARPQVIAPEHNPLMHDVLTAYYRLTGFPCVVNTSFNNHEEPIVCDPSDAIQSLIRGNVDVLLIGNFAAVLHHDPYRVLPLLHKSPQAQCAHT
jgi:carbamoyltransferase